MCTCGNGKYLRSIVGGSVIRCVEIIEVKKTVPTKTVSANFNNEKITCKVENLLLVT